MESQKNIKREIKKNPKYKLENFSKLFLQMGLVVTLLIIFVLFENKTEIYSPNDIKDTSVASNEEFELIDFEEMPEEEVPEEEVPEEVVPEVEIEELEQVEDEEIIADVIIKQDDTPPEPIEDFKAPPPPAPKKVIKREVSFMKIEQAPMFPGCESKKGEKEKKKCLQLKIAKHVGRHFNADLAQELGLDAGPKRIMVQFKIDQKGNITNIVAAAPHPRLKKEAARIIKKLPKMKPGMQRNQPVIVKYALPINFIVE